MATGPGHRRGTLRAATDPGYPALKARIIARTGHHYYADKDDLLFDRLARRFRALGLPDAGAYAAHLDGPAGAAEWAVLEAETTIGETFFFRYAEQFAALRDSILPDLIAARRAERTLRIWSAGCSTGAEPYSLAILLHDLLGPERAHWSLTLLGTDLNAAALTAARAAEYGRWALRTTGAQDRQRWFQPAPARAGATREGGYRLRPEFRRMVRFEQLNLLDLIEGRAPPALGAFDLILCRNVLIYFSPEHVLGLMQAFADRLRRGGWLLIGHAEPNPAFETWLDPVALPGTAAYRRRAAAGVAGVEEATRTAPRTAPTLPVPPAPPVEPLPHPAAVPPPTPAPAGAPLEPSDGREAAPDLARIRALADAGETKPAWRLLRAALAADPTAAPLRFYEGLLAQSLGRSGEAERALRGALFLDRDFVLAHLQLGLLLAAQARPREAARALDNALALAEGLAPETVLPEGDGVTAREAARTARRARQDLEGLVR